MNIRNLVTVCSALVILVGCGGDGGSGSSKSSTGTSGFDAKKMAMSMADLFSDDLQVTGVVSSGAPLVGVVVSATDRHGNVTQSALTDSNGRYTINVKWSQPYVLTTSFNDIDGTPATLSSVYVANSSGNGTQANLNPLTSLITSRVLGLIPTSELTGDQIQKAEINQEKIDKATSDITNLFQPVYTALGIPHTEARDPIGSTTYQANMIDPLENMFTLARFKVRSGQVTVGTDANRFLVNIPPVGALPLGIPDTAVNSIAALNAGITRTPITNVIVVIGENRSFDSIFATYQAPAGQSIKNLLSQGIINSDGSAGPNFGMTQQNQAVAPTTYSINPERSTPFAYLPQPTQMGQVAWVGLPNLFITLGGTKDPRFPTDLPNGSFQQTNYVPYLASPTFPKLDPGEVSPITADPPHRFFQMWQQTAGTNAKLDMFTWVAVTAGQGGDTAGVEATNPAQGGELMGFLNMHQGDIPSWKAYATQYAISDNYHQSIMGGTGANFFAIATGDVPYFNTNGVITTPFENQIENPNPLDGYPNFYIQDGYQGGSYVNCSDPAQPGVAPILAALSSNNVQSKCEAGKYYLVNNYAWGYTMTGRVQDVGAYNYVLPPQTVPTIAESLASKGISWKWYTGAREVGDIASDLALFGLPNLPPYQQKGQQIQYNAIGDPLVASSNIMNPESTLKAGLVGLTTLYNDIKNGTLPAVSFVVPKNLDSGHPGYSVQAKYETFTQDLIKKVQDNPALWKNTAIIVTTDEGGGYFDTGSIQMQDFFGDGPRVPLMVISPYARTNHIDHIYHDHASLLKFIQRNWKLAPLSARSRDNHPNPVTTSADLYKPINKTPTVGDLMTLFAFEGAPQVQ